MPLVSTNCLNEIMQDGPDCNHGHGESDDDDSDDDDCHDRYTEEELKTMSCALAEARQTKSYVQELTELINAQAAAAAGSSNGAVATATPAAPTLLPLAAMNPEYIAKCFGIRKIRVEYVTKFQATLEAFREMENNGAITLGFKTQNLSIFGMTSIHVIDQNKWNETMIKYARSYTRHCQLKTKNYQTQIYHVLWSLGFHSWGTDETAHKANGSKSTHICHNAWNYTHKAFLEKKGRFIGLGHA